MESQPTTGDASPEDGGVPAVEQEFVGAQRRVFEAAGVPFGSRNVDLGPPYGRVHVVEAGDPSGEPPVVFVHGVLNFGAMFAPLMGHLDGMRLLAIDRPGWGLSDDFRYDVATHRRTAVDVLEGVLDAEGADRADVVGHSTGGYWGLTLALARPERVRRLVALGGVPAFPGTRAPVSLRLLTLPVLPRFIVPRGHPTAETVVELLSTVGEGETIQEYPELVAARVAHDRNPRTLPVARSELGSFQTLLGWRRGVPLTTRDLRSIETPTTFVWGDEDLLGHPEAVRASVESMPDASLERLTGGHIPWLGHPEACAELVAGSRA